MSSSLEEEINQFYNSLESTLSFIPKEDVKVIMKDWNIKLGEKNTCSKEVMWRYGYEGKKERGEPLIEFHSKYNLCITNIHFQQKESIKWTWKTLAFFDKKLWYKPRCRQRLRPQPSKMQIPSTFSISAKQKWK